jgi:hypothetical protein
MICQCSMCGRVRDEDGAWTRDDAIEPGVVGFCPTCKDLQNLSRKKGWKATGKELLAQRREGYGQAPADVDVFKGFKGE